MTDHNGLLMPILRASCSAGGVLSSKRADRPCKRFLVRVIPNSCKHPS